jgi:hypothetical protein
MPMPPRPEAVAIAAIVSVAGRGSSHQQGQGVQGARSIWRVITHCWAIDSRLFTSQ